MANCMLRGEASKEVNQNFSESNLDEETDMLRDKMVGRQIG